VIPAIVTAAAISAALAYHPAGDRPAPHGDRLLWAEAGAAIAHWNRSGDDVRRACPDGIALRVATTLDGDGATWVDGRGEGCRAWLASWMLRSDRQQLREGRFDWPSDRATIADECAEVTHELGHAIGLAHTSNGGVMDAAVVAPTAECRRLAWRLAHDHALRSRLDRGTTSSIVVTGSPSASLVPPSVSAGTVLRTSTRTSARPGGT